MTRIGWKSGDGPAALAEREWLVTNGLGGYASGTIGGVNTRRYHGLLVAALANPLGRVMMFNHLSEQVRLPDGTITWLGAPRPDGGAGGDGRGPHGANPAPNLTEFRLELGLPVWTYVLPPGFVIEKRLVLAHQQNTVTLIYRLLEGKAPLRLSLRPAVHFRPHDAPVSHDMGEPYALTGVAGRFEVSGGRDLPTLRLRAIGELPTFVFQQARHQRLAYRTEEARGYEAQGELWSLGHFKMLLAPDTPANLVASTESWPIMNALGPGEVLGYEIERRKRLVRVGGAESSDPAAELVLAADQFLIAPTGRIEALTRARAEGEELRSVIAGYHWFTDWGRDTMISLEGLALTTGRPQEARPVLHSFAHHVLDGLIPNLFPEGEEKGLYHTADATLWYFHAVDRYLAATQDRASLTRLLPRLEGIVAAHQAGTRFGIHVDPKDGLLIQGQDGYQLTWMDAKCDGWVVTPRRGKAVEINALWYNALRLLAGWLREEAGAERAAAVAAAAERAFESFNRRFWCADEQHLHDVVDTPDGGVDSSFRPNQIFAISLPHPVLLRERWAPVVDQVAERLLTPVGLRSLAREAPDYKPTYHGDLRTRDAAYHQGTVWSWLIGPFVDAWLRVHPDRRHEARGFLQGLVDHLGAACIGTVSEVFDAEPPFTPRGCVAQAWGVAELLRAWRKTGPG